MGNTILNNFKRSAVTALLAGGLSWSAWAAEPRDYDLPAGALSATLNRIATESGVVLSVDPALVEGRQSAPVQGRHEPEQALREALKGSGLELLRGESGVLTLRPLPAAAVTLPAVPVQDQAASLLDPGRTEGSGSYAAVASTTAFKLPLTPREIPQAITVIPQAAIKDFGLTDIRRILMFTPGVHVSSERGPQAYYFQSRGNEMQVQYDGVPSSNRFGNRSEGMTFDTATIDRVEVLHGAAGLLTGPGKPGGTVNVIRKLPTDKAQVAMEAGGDSWGGWRGMADVSGALGDSGVSGRLVTVYEKQDSYIDDASGKHSVLYGVIGKRFGTDTELYAGVNLEQVIDASYGSHYGLPANIDGSLLDVPREKNLGADWADQDNAMDTVFLRLRHAFSADWTLHGMFTYEDFETQQIEAIAARNRDENDYQNIYLYSQIENWYSDTQALDLYLQGRFALFGRQHELMLGFNGARKDHGGDGGASPTFLAVIDPATWDPSQAPGPFSKGWVDYGSWSGEFEQYGFFGGTRLSLLDPLHMIVGTRVSWVRQDYDGVTSNKEDAVATWYGGLVWDFSRLVSAYASYSDIFEPHSVTTIDSNGQVLNSIVGENYEVGLKLEAYEGRLNGTLAVFRLDQTNLAEPDIGGGEVPGVCGGNTLDPCSKATGLIRSEGFELSLAGEIVRGWQVLGGYTHFKRDRKDGELDPYAAKTPEHQLHFATSYTPADKRWTVGATARWQEQTTYGGDIFFLPGQEFRTVQKGYTVVGLFGGYQITPKLRLNAAVDNLFDETYLSGLEWPIGGLVYGDPRRASLTLRAEF